MQQWFVSILAVLYLTITSGFIVHSHYCMDQLIGTSLWHDHGEVHRCNKCGMTQSESEGCCKDVHELVKTDDEHHPAPVFEHAAKLWTGIPQRPEGLCEAGILEHKTAFTATAHGPPAIPRRSEPLFIRYCSLLI